MRDNPNRNIILITWYLPVNQPVTVFLQVIWTMCGLNSWNGPASLLFRQRTEEQSGNFWEFIFLVGICVCWVLNNYLNYSIDRLATCRCVGYRSPSSTFDTGRITKYWRRKKCMKNDTLPKLKLSIFWLTTLIVRSYKCLVG